MSAFGRTQQLPGQAASGERRDTVAGRGPWVGVSRGSRGSVPAWPGPGPTRLRGCEDGQLCDSGGRAAHTRGSQDPEAAALPSSAHESASVAWVPFLALRRSGRLGRPAGDSWGLRTEPRRWLRRSPSSPRESVKVPAEAPARVTHRNLTRGKVPLGTRGVQSTWPGLDVTSRLSDLFENLSRERFSA